MTENDNKNIQLFNADCLETLSTISAGSVDMILTDLPYGITANKWDSVIPLPAMWSEFLRVTKPTAVIALTASQPFSSMLVMSQPKMFRHEWIWIKPCGSNFLNSNREPMREHESALIFSRGKWTYNKQMQERAESAKKLIGKTCKGFASSPNQNYKENSDFNMRTYKELRVPSSCQKFNRNTGLHPTQKPVDLMRYLIRTYTNEGETVMDVTMGSGTTGVAALLEKRKFIGIERNEDYFKIAEHR